MAAEDTNLQRYYLYKTYGVKLQRTKRDFVSSEAGSWRESGDFFLDPADERIYFDRVRFFKCAP